MTMLSSQEIAEAKKAVVYRHPNPVHEHDDCVRLAYEWLDAQIKTKAARRGYPYALKHIIENWAGRYVSESDVSVAAQLHPQIHGRYPYFNISSRLTQPSDKRLAGIGEAKTQHYHTDRPHLVYARKEEA